jgi:hypothetical protein
MIGDDMILLFRGPVVDQMLIGNIRSHTRRQRCKPVVTNHLPRRELADRLYCDEVVNGAEIRAIVAGKSAPPKPNLDA